MLEHRPDGVAGVEVPDAVLKVGARKQDLPDIEAVDGKEVLPGVEEAVLPDGCDHLPVDEVLGELGVPQGLAPGGLRAAAYHDDLHAAALEPCELADNFNHMGQAQPVPSLGKHACAELDHYGLWCFHVHCCYLRYQSTALLTASSSIAAILPRSRRITSETSAASEIFSMSLSGTSGSPFMPMICRGTCMPVRNTP